MTRGHVRSKGSRSYADYSEEKLDECLRRIKSGDLSQRNAAREYKIPRSTLKNKLKGIHKKRVGRPPILEYEEERLILNRVQLLCNYGFPATTLDVQHYIQAYLNTKNRVIPQFQNNLPGKEYMWYFLKRHKDYTKRLTSNIKRARAAVDERILREFHENLEKEVTGVPPENIWNFDETALVNDPGRTKCIMKRGTRYPERVINNTKAGVSVMFCGNAAGRVLPPYCVYKSQAVIMDAWVRGAPPGTKFSRSKSGWFDEGIFEKWFNDMLLPELKKQNGKKVIIGDNLSSHISELVIRKCEKYDIKFICLPPNSTHLCQPLDVAYFSPLKKEWRKILNEFRKTKVGQKETSIPKDIFPQLLTKLVKALHDGNGAKNVISGFKKCGIYPLNLTQLLSNLPSAKTENDEDNVAAADTSLLNILTEMRAEGPKRAKKSKKISIVAGKSVCTDDFNNQEEEDEEAPKPAKKKKATPKASAKQGSSKENVPEDEKPSSSTKSKKKKTSKVSSVVQSRKVTQSQKSRELRKKLLSMTSKNDSDSELSVSEISEADFNINSDREDLTDTEALDASTAEAPAKKQKITPGMYVKILQEPYKDYYATVVGSSYGDELEINYFEKKLGGFVLKDMDLDSREKEDLMVVTANIIKRGHFTFNE